MSQQNLRNNSAVLLSLFAAAYVTAQVLADISSLRLVDIFGKALDGGTFIYPITFTLRDLIHKLAGKRIARIFIVVAAGINLFMAALFWFVARLPLSPESIPQSELFADVLGPVWRIVFASIIAEVISELIDTEIYSAWVRKFGQTKQWGRVLASNAVAVPIDSVVFTVIAFSGILSWSTSLEIIQINILFKSAVTVVSIPLIYTIKPPELADIQRA